MENKYKYYFKILNDELFGGEHSEGYICLTFKDKKDNPLELAQKALYITEFSSNVEIIEISKEEYES